VKSFSLIAKPLFTLTESTCNSNGPSFVMQHSRSWRDV